VPLKAPAETNEPLLRRMLGLFTGG
jgi:hypothetical protein